VFVKRHRASGTVKCAQNAFVPCGEHSEHDNWNNEEPRGSRSGEDEPRRDDECRDDGETGVADTRVEAGEARMFLCARLPPVAIFG
jgi:hypothetical protein